MRSLFLLGSLLSLLSLVACSDGGGKGGAEGGAGVEGSVTWSGGEAALVDGRAFEDEGADGAVRVILSSFALSCSAVEDGVGFNTPADGVYVNFYPEDPLGGLELFANVEGTTSLQETFPFETTAAASGAMIVGTVTLEGDAGDAAFSVDNCGSMDPFGS